MKNVLVTGSQGFIGSYICSELLEHGYKVTGIDNYSKYGKVSRSHDNHPHFKLYPEDVILMDSFPSSDFIIACAAMIGGISYFHKYAYDLLATNERIIASTFDQALRLFRDGCLQRILVLSSSMVYENTQVFPTPEDEVCRCSSPSSTYGFQKLATEYFCKGAHEQYGLPYTIVRPFNCVGVGEDESIGDGETKVGGIKMMMSHVLPDLVYRASKLGKDAPLTILGSGEQIRNYTNGKDIGRAIRVILESEKAINDDFNISSPRSTTVKELATIVYQQLYGVDPIFEYQEGFKYDVQMRMPDVSKSEKVLGIKCNIPLEESVDEVIKWMLRRGNR